MVGGWVVLLTKKLEVHRYRKTESARNKYIIQACKTSPEKTKKCIAYITHGMLTSL